MYLISIFICKVNEAWSLKSISSLLIHSEITNGIHRTVWEGEEKRKPAWWVLRGFFFCFKLFFCFFYNLCLYLLIYGKLFIMRGPHELGLCQLSNTRSKNLKPFGHSFPIQSENPLSPELRPPSPTNSILMWFTWIFFFLRKTNWLT